MVANKDKSEALQVECLSLVESHQCIAAQSKSLLDFTSVFFLQYIDLHGAHQYGSLHCTALI